MNGAPTPSGPRVALAAVWLGKVQRGFERFCSDLFDLLRDEMDITLFKGGGEVGPRERIPTLLGPASRVARALPLGKELERPGYKRDCLAFGLCLLPELLRGRYDVVHCIDPPLARVLCSLKRLFRFRARLLFTEACAMPPRFYPQVGHLHHVAKYWYDGALEHGVPASDMTLIPCGVRTERFAARLDRRELRRKFEVPERTFVILAVSNLDRPHKRVHHIIEEAAALEGDVLVWLDGHPADPTLVDLAHERLGSRCRITHVSSDEVKLLYGLADVFVHASLFEAFGLVLVEAASSGLTVLAHDDVHFEWILGDREYLVDMETTGRLTARLRECMARRDSLDERAGARAAEVRRRFDWDSIRSDYEMLYRRVAALNPATTVGE